MKIYELISLFSKEFKKDSSMFISIANSILESKTEEAKDAGIQTYIQNIHRICDASASLGLNGLYLFLQKINQNLYELKSLDLQSQSMVESFYKDWPQLVINYLDFIVDNAPDFKGSPNALVLEEKSLSLMSFLSEPPACLELDPSEYEFIYSCLVEALQVDDKVRELIDSISSEEKTISSFAPLDLLLSPPQVSLKLLPDYLKESLVNVAEIYKALDLLISSPSNNSNINSTAVHSPSEIVSTMKRAAHTIKGSSQMAGITPVSTLMHKLEDSMDNNSSLLPLSTILNRPAEYAKVCLPLVDFVSNFLEFLHSPSALVDNQLTLQNQQRLGVSTIEHFLESISDLNALPLINQETLEAPQSSSALSSPSVLLPPTAAMPQYLGTQFEKNEELFAITKFCQENLEKLDFLINSHPSFSRTSVDEMDIKNDNHVNFNIELNQEIKRLIDDVSKKQVSAALLCLEAKMIDVASIQQRLSRVVRTSSVDTAKAINFTFNSNSTFIESNILKQALDPFMHILRNCVDHGIEGQELRAKAGKTLEGNISFTASYLNNGVLFKLSDDGYGLDLLKILNKAKKLNLIDDEKYALILEDINSSINSSFLLDIIFKENFSTKETLNALSGRGVGLDIVKKTISALGGNIEVKTKAGVYCDFLIWLPSSISLVQSVIFEASSQLFALPASAIETLLDASSFKLISKDNSFYINPIASFFYSLAPSTLETITNPNTNTNLIPSLFFNSLLSGPLSNINSSLSSINAQPAIIFKDKDLGAILVDKIITVQSLILEKPKCLGPARAYVSNVATIKNGSIVSLINYSSLLEFVDSKALVFPSVNSNANIKIKDTKKIIIIDDSPLMRKALNEFLSAEGFDVMGFDNGQSALEYLQSNLSSYCPYLVITDLEMPNLNGFETIMGIKDLFIAPTNSHLPSPQFIMLSSKSTPINIDKAKSLGCLDFVAKPYNEARLLSLIHTAS